MSTPSVELVDIRLLLKIADTGGLSTAAKLLGIPKTSATRQLQRLERAVGCRLVHRAAGRFALTEEGRKFLPGAAKGLAAIDGSVSDIQAKQAPLAGLLRIAAPYTFGRKIIGPRLPLFMNRHPALAVSLILGSTHADLLADEADVAIRIGHTGGQSLISRRLCNERFVLCASPAYLERAPLACIEDLSEHRFLDIRPGPVVRQVTFENVTESRRMTVKPILQTNEPEIVIQSAVHGAGVAILPFSMVGNLLASGTLVLCLPAWTLPLWEVNALYAPGRGNAPKVRAFLDYLLENFPLGEYGMVL